MTKKVRTSDELLKDNLLVKLLAGSHAYGTALPTSDVDYRGIFCADPINILTPFFPIREKVDEQEEDSKFYELSHFMKLCLDCNPNIIELLWTDDVDIIFRTPAYDFLREHRQKFLSSKIAFTTSGYAIAQLKRIKGHNRWITNPQPKEPPRQIDFLSLVQWFGDTKKFKLNWLEYHENFRLIPYGQDVYGLYEEQGRKLFNENTFTLNIAYDESVSEARKTPLAVVKFNKAEYETAKEKHKQYWIWKKNRNERRSELEEKFEYDTKHAMHLVRLLRMGKEALEDGVILVKRPDAEELLSIRNGAWTYEQCVAYAEEMDVLIREKLYKTTSLPKKPNLVEAAELLMKAQRMVWYG